MVLNLFHTIAITCAIGTNFYIKPQQNNLPNRNVVSQNYSIEQTINQNDYVEEQTTTVNVDQQLGAYYTVHNYLSPTYTIQNSYLQAQITASYTNTIINGRWNNKTYQTSNFIGKSNNQIGHVNGKIRYTFTDQLYETNVNVYQELYFISWTPTNANQQTKININNVVSNIYSTNDKTIGAYISVFSTTSTAMSIIFESLRNESDFRDWTAFYNYNNYEAYTDAISDGGGYVGSMQDMYIEYDNYLNLSQYGEMNLEKEIYITNNKTTYTLIYIEPRFMTNTPTDEYGSNIWTAGNLQSYIKPLKNTITLEGVNIIGSGSAEVVDLPGTMFQVLGMPFTFISMAFNLTIFPGTPYEINFSMLFLAILGVAIFVILINVILGIVRKT